jgi:hypothetical protein
MSQSPVTPASRADATTALRALFEAFPADRGNGMGGAATYLIAIEGYSLPAIQKAVKRLIRGEFDWVVGRFLPTTAELSRACRYCEELIAPPKRLALPAPGDVRDDSPEGVAHRQAAIERCRMNRWDWTQIAEAKAEMPDPTKPAKGSDEWESQTKQEIAATGLPKLSEEARALFREQAERAVSIPADQFGPTPSQSKERAA